MAFMRFFVILFRLFVFVVRSVFSPFNLLLFYFSSLFLLSSTLLVVRERLP